MSVVGEQIGSYKLEAQLGEGGMGEVFLGRHVAIGRAVALKLLHARHAGNTVMHERFVREAKLANRVRHDNVVEITELSQLPDGRPYLVMELIDGADLHSLWDGERGLDLQTFVEVVRQIAGALGAAHHAGVVHRDLKPQNLFVTRRSDGGIRMRVIDFGAARVLNEDDRLTRTGDVIATASYMSPEQAMGSPVDARSDVYSLGVVLWELVVGERPFVGNSFGEFVLLHAQRKPKAPSRAGSCKLAGGIPAELDAILLKCLAKRPEQRYQSAAELQLAVEALLAPPAPAPWHKRHRPALLAASALSLAAALTFSLVRSAASNNRSEKSAEQIAASPASEHRSAESTAESARMAATEHRSGQGSAQERAAESARMAATEHRSGQGSAQERAAESTRMAATEHRSAEGSAQERAAESARLAATEHRSGEGSAQERAAESARLAATGHGSGEGSAQERAAEPEAEAARVAAAERVPVSVAPTFAPTVVVRAQRPRKKVRARNADPFSASVLKNPFGGTP